jgi:FkbM family methyltransferase
MDDKEIAAERDTNFALPACPVFMGPPIRRLSDARWSRTQTTSARENNKRRTVMADSTAPSFGSKLGSLGDKFAGRITMGGLARGSSEPSIPPPLPDGEFELVEVDAGGFWMSRNDEVMRPFMQRAKTWEPEEGRLLRSFVRPGCRFLDIGANIGYFSVLIGNAAPGVIVHSVEPDPGNVKALRFNLWNNRVPATVWPLALDNRDRHLHLSGNAHNLGDLRSARVSPAAVDEPPEALDPEGPPSGWIVPAASGDELFANQTFDLVKVDVQGWEFEVLLGLDSVLSRSTGVHIVTEFWPAPLRATDRSPADLLARYRQLGYRIRVSVGDNLVQMSDTEVVELCDSGGPDGQVNLLLER